MSSTNRNGTPRHKFNYYVTPLWAIRQFLRAWDEDTGIPSRLAGSNAVVLDPCAGGDVTNEMSYPTVLQEYGYTQGQMLTLDIRPDSRAQLRPVDYLKTCFIDAGSSLVISNPPFNLALDFVQKALRETRIGGYVIMLLRYSFLGTQERSEWLQMNYPERVYLHSKRIGFKPDCSRTDSTDYCHMVWRVGRVANSATQRTLLPPTEPDMGAIAVPRQRSQRCKYAIAKPHRVASAVAPQMCVRV